MNYWIKKRNQSIKYSLEVTSNRVILNEFYLQEASFKNQKLNFSFHLNSSIEATIKSMLDPNLIYNHDGELRVYKDGVLRECWLLADMKYVSCYTSFLRSNSITCSVSSWVIPNINSDYIKSS